MINKNMINFNKNPTSDFISPSTLTDEIKIQTGYNLCQLMSEALSLERQNFIATGNSKAYFSLLVPIFNKFAIPAPSNVVIGNPMEDMSKEELEGYRNNLLTRLALSSKPKTPDID